MVVILYEVSDDNRVVTKTLNNLISVDCTIYNDVKILKPVLLLDYRATLTTYNYAYISEYGRYYYIDDITLLPGGKMQLTLSVDVLMTYADDIKNLVGTVDRSQSKFNGYIVDDKYKSVAYRQIVAKKFPNSMENDSLILMTVG